MRKWVGALFIVFLFALLLLIPTANQPLRGAAKSKSSAIADSGSSTQPISFGIYSAGLADSGGRKVAVLQLYLLPAQEGGRLSVVCLPQPIQKNMLLLSHAAAPGVNQSLSEKIARQLSLCGFSSRTAGAEDALGSKNSVIISPTGALPEEFSNASEALLRQNSRLVLLESLPGRQISAQGELSFSGSAGNFTSVRLEVGKEGEAALQAARAAMLPLGASEEIPMQPGNITAAIGVEDGTAYCRAIYLSPLGCRFADTGLLLGLQGSAQGPSEFIAGKQQAFEFSLPNGSEYGRTLRFFAVAYRGNEETGRQEIAGGRIAGDWASSFAFSSGRGGQYLLQIVDQFGRLHAAAYARVLGLEVEPVQRGGTRFEFSASFGGQPINGAVQAWLDEGEKKEYYSSNGTLVVWAAPSEGKHEMHFSYQGLQSGYSFVSEGGGPLDTYIRLGIPSLVFLLAVHFLLRAGSKAKYTIKFPLLAPTDAKTLRVESGQLAQAYCEADRRLGGHFLPAYPEEIGRLLLPICGWKKEANLDSGSLIAALRTLAPQGDFLECNGGFILKGKSGGFSPSELSALRLLHDMLLEQGIPFRRSRLLPLKGSDLELALFTSKKSALSGMGKGRRALVFSAKEALEEFGRSLEEPNEENTRIKLAISNGKLLLLAANRSGLERVLP